MGNRKTTPKYGRNFCPCTRVVAFTSICVCKRATPRTGPSGAELCHSMSTGVTGVGGRGAQICMFEWAQLRTFAVLNLFVFMLWIRSGEWFGDVSSWSGLAKQSVIADQSLILQLFWTQPAAVQCISLVTGNIGKTARHTRLDEEREQRKRSVSRYVWSEILYIVYRVVRWCSPDHDSHCLE